MKKDGKKQLQEKLKNELELLTKQKLPDSVAWESLFNLSGFFSVLRRMREEAKYGVL
jgi:hypothetical protein